MARRWKALVAVLSPYGIGFLVLAGLSASGISETLNLLLYDVSLNLRAAPSGRSTPVRLIGIDEADIRRYGWPLDDHLLSQAVQRLSRDGALAIGIDLYRDRGMGPGAEELRQELRRNPKVVAIFNAAEAIPAPPTTPARQQAFNDLVLDSDGVLRRDLVHVDGQPENSLALPLRLLEVAQGHAKLRQRFNKEPLRQQWLQASSGGYSQVDASGRQRMLAFHQPGSFPLWSLTQLLNGQIPPAQIKGSLVLIGSTAASLRDSFNTPFTRFSSAASLATMPGVEVHGHRLAALVDLEGGGKFQMEALPSWAEGLLLLIAIGAGIAIGEAAQALRRSGWLLLIGEIVLLGLGFGLLLNGYWLAVSLPAASLAVLTAAGWLRRGAASQLQRRQIERLLGQTTSPEVAAELWKQRETLLEEGRFPGRQLAVTILFADIVGFSKVSERLPPTDTLQWVNRGMELFVPLIHRHGGMVNKFTGDGFLAVFGVPVAQDPRQTATNAIATGQALQGAVAELKKELLAEQRPIMRLRVGIHSGEVITGSMGSSERMEYAVIGDVVNVSARLESLEKERMDSDCRVLVSETTLELVEAKDWPLNNWGDFPLKGRDQTVNVYELIANDNQSC